ncbi:hypothetical protein ACS49_00275 [Bacillus cereus]|nr:hypothetical protein ACS49_00275 [Bacillus cereus]
MLFGIEVFHKLEVVLESSVANITKKTGFLGVHRTHKCHTVELVNLLQLLPARLKKLAHVLLRRRVSSLIGLLLPPSRPLRILGLVPGPTTVGVGGRHRSIK